MTIKIFVTKQLYNYKTFFIQLFNKLDIKIKFLDNYDNDVDIIIIWFNNIFIKNPSYFNKYKNNYTIINRIENSYLLTNKSLLNDYNFCPYSFTIKFNYLKYDKNLMKKYIDNYNYNTNFGKDFWIMKYDNSSAGTGTLIITTNELLNLDTNKRFLDEISNFNNKNINYIIQKYLEKPALIDDRKYDIRVYVVFLSKPSNKSISYKFYLYNKIYVRITKHKYDLNNLDKKIHLTNTSIQVNSSLYEMSHFLDKDIYNKIYDKIYIQLRDLISSTKFIDIIKENNNYPYLYNVFGIDFLLDKDYNTYMVDFNSIPSLTIVRYQGIRYLYTGIHLLRCIYFKIIRIYNKY